MHRGLARFESTVPPADVKYSIVDKMRQNVRRKIAKNVWLLSLTGCFWDIFLVKIIPQTCETIKKYFSLSIFQNIYFYYLAEMCIKERSFEGKGLGSSIYRFYFIFNPQSSPNNSLIFGKFRKMA